MTVIYPINGRNERMGSLFNTPKHLLTVEGKEIIVESIRIVCSTYGATKTIIATNEDYYNQLEKLFVDNSNVEIRIVGKTNSQVETLRKITTTITGSVMFVDCDILPTTLSEFNRSYPTVFTFRNTAKLLNYSNYKANRFKTILDCNEKDKFYQNAGTGIYYFPDVSAFNQYSANCKSVSECVKQMIQDKVKAKINTDSVVRRLGTLQDIYIDDFSFRQPKTKDLSTGFTDNKVYKSRYSVTKIGKTVASEHTWYNCFINKKHIPKVLNFSGNTITLEFIKRDADIDLDAILDLVDGYKTYQKLNTLDFSNYIQNIEKHLANNPTITNGSQLVSSLNSLQVTPTFCHGDLSIMNIIPTKLGIKLIDPLYSDLKFGSYELDIAKLCFSFKFYKNDSASFLYLKHKTSIPYLDVLIAAEAVRVSSYKREYSFIAENLIRELYN